MPRYDDDYRADQDDRRRGRPYHRGEVASAHSMLGILSFLAALLSGLVIFVLLVAVGVLVARDGDIADDSPEAIAAGVGLVAGMVVALAGLILGVIGLNQRARKLFPILGTVFNGVILLGASAILCVGLLAG